MDIEADMTVSQSQHLSLAEGTTPSLQTSFYLCAF